MGKVKFIEEGLKNIIQFENKKNPRKYEHINHQFNKK